MIVGCNHISCPIYKTVKVTAESNTYIDSTCYMCGSYSSEGVCMSQIPYDCSFWVTNVFYNDEAVIKAPLSDGFAVLTTPTIANLLEDIPNTDNQEIKRCTITGFVSPGSSFDIFVNKFNGDCNGDVTAVKNLPYVGIVFLSLFFTIVIYCLIIGIWVSIQTFIECRKRRRMIHDPTMTVVVSSCESGCC